MQLSSPPRGNGLPAGKHLLPIPPDKRRQKNTTHEKSTLMQVCPQEQAGPRWQCWGRQGHSLHWMVTGPF